ncbi:hypothetical protein BHM03_00062702 [Ensete ventricosum]|nr:hypothetical protein BHM03_00062702 [Ensete ventricosum]
MQRWSHAAMVANKGGSLRPGRRGSRPRPAHKGRSLIARPQGQPHGRSQERPTAGVVPTQGDIARPEGLSPEATVPTHRQGQR